MISCLLREAIIVLTIKTALFSNSNNPNTLQGELVNGRLGEPGSDGKMGLPGRKGLRGENGQLGRNGEQH